MRRFDEIVDDIREEARDLVGGAALEAMRIVAKRAGVPTGELSHWDVLELAALLAIREAVNDRVIEREIEKAAQQVALRVLHRQIHAGR